MATMTALYPTASRTVSPTVSAPSVTATPRRPRAKRGDGDRLRDEILAATETLLIQTGDVDAVSVRAVAEVVGCTAPAIYLHFVDKAELLLEVCGIRYRQLNEFVRTAIANITDPVETLRASVRAYIQFGLEYPQHYRVLFMQPGLMDPALWEALRLQGISGIDALVDRCSRAIATGGMRETDPYLMAVGLWTMAHGLVSLRIVKPRFDWPDMERTIQHAVDTHINGLLRP
jgi:AcrR family transcriptional regulator